MKVVTLCGSMKSKMSGFDSHLTVTDTENMKNTENGQKEDGEIAKLSLGVKGKILYFYLINLFTN